jgi:rare lipoprotein A
MRKKVWLAIWCVLFATSFAGLAGARQKPRSRVMQATAFVGKGETTASGTVAHEGIVAADPAVLPMGTRIRVTGSHGYDGIYLVTDTGAKVDGAHIDLCLKSEAEARRFGKRRVRVQVLKVGEGKENAREKDGPAVARRER